MFPKRKNWLLLLILAALLIAGCNGNAPAPQDTPSPGKALEQQNGVQATPNSPGSNQETMRITIYHATKDAMYLIPEVHSVPKNDHPAKTALELLINGTKNPELVSVVPPGTKLNSIRIKDHIAYVNFNDKIIKNHSGGSAGETLLVGAIVNTLTEFPEIEKVQLLVEGKKIDTIAGHLDTSEPLSRSEKIIKK